MRIPMLGLVGLVFSACTEYKVTNKETGSTAETPDININGENWGTVGKPLTLTAFSDQENITFSWSPEDGGVYLDPPIEGNSFTFSWQNPGSHTIKITATDENGKSLSSIDFRVNIYSAEVDDTATACYDLPSRIIASRSPLSISEYSDTIVTYQVIGINECGNLLPAENVYLLDPEAFANMASIVEEVYNAETGNYTLSVQFYTAGVDSGMSNFFTLQLVGINNGSSTEELYFPTFDEIYLSSYESAESGSPVDYSLQPFAPSGSHDFSWMVDGELKGTDTTFAYTFENPSEVSGAVLPGNHTVEVRFYPFNSSVEAAPADFISLSDQIAIWPPSEAE